MVIGLHALLLSRKVASMVYVVLLIGDSVHYFYHVLAIIQLYPSPCRSLKHEV